MSVRRFFTMFIVLFGMLTSSVVMSSVAMSAESNSQHLNIKHLLESQIISGQSKIQIAEIEVDPNRIDEFRKLVWTVGEISTESEPGVLLLFSASQKEDPTKFVVVEVYKDQKAYESHLKTQHFLDYKKGTEGIVKSLKLVQYDALSTFMKN